MFVVRSLLSLSLVCVAAVVWLATQNELKKPRNLHDVGYATAAKCTRCHPAHAESFARTFHRTMTQLPSPASVLGDFDGAELRYFGVTASMHREGDDYVVRYAGPDVPEQRFVVVKTIGSRRYQQYVAEQDGELVRLPVAYHLGERRWFHMNGAFLTPDPDVPAQGLREVDFERHVTRWNDNCIFCHNVAPNPGRSRRGDTFESEVAEHGVACEACHGPGQEHQSLNENPLRRYMLHLSEKADPTIVHPGRLSSERASDVCGRCHGQRITDDVDAFLAHGDPFVPGDDLSLYSAPLWRDTTLRGEASVFAARFWDDGTPRLTAYEYQGLLSSRCASEGSLTCTRCHGMHEGDPRGQIRPSQRGDAMCTGCHDAFASEAQRAAHARHDVRDGSPSCVDCHMPKVVYGVLDTHVSHRIERPSPALARTRHRPDACTLCHVERTRAWAEDAFAALWPDAAVETVPSDEPIEQPLSEVERTALAGDPVERVVALAAMAAAGSARGQRASLRRALFLEVMREDPYPLVRRFARDALVAQLARERSEWTEVVARWIPETGSEARRDFLSQLPDTWTKAAPLARPRVEALRQQAKDLAIEIGE